MEDLWILLLQLYLHLTMKQYSPSSQRPKVRGGGGGGSPQFSKLTSDEIGYIPNGWVEATNCREKAKYLVAAQKDLESHIQNGI